MNLLIENKHFDALKIFYDKLQDEMLKQKQKKKDESILFSFLEKSSNVASKLLNDSSIFSTKINDNSMLFLKEYELIRKSDEIDKLNEYVITSRGIWVIEEKLLSLNIEKLLDYLQNSKFSFPESNEPLNTKEKIIILSLLATRSFSKNTSMNLSISGNPDIWIQIFDQTSNFLVDLNQINTSAWKDNKMGNEHPITYLMRRANKLPKKTKHIFNFIGNQNYFLEIEPQVMDSSNSRLSFLFRLIFPRIINMPELTLINNFLVDIAYNKSNQLRDDFSYINYEWDLRIKNILTNNFLEY